MSEHARDRSSSATLEDSALRTAWYLPIARLLGRSSRFATDEMSHLIKVAKDVVVDSVKPDTPPRRDLRAGPTVPALLEELVQIVSQSDRALLERDRKFWCLVRELYSRRPWVPRRPRELIDTVGSEVKEPAAARTADTTTTAPVSMESDVERMST